MVSGGWTPLIILLVCLRLCAELQTSLGHVACTGQHVYFNHVRNAESRHMVQFPRFVSTDLKPKKLLCPKLFPGVVPVSTILMSSAIWKQVINTARTTKSKNINQQRLMRYEQKKSSGSNVSVTGLG